MQGSSQHLVQDELPSQSEGSFLPSSWKISMEMTDPHTRPWWDKSHSIWELTVNLNALCQHEQEQKTVIHEWTKSGHDSHKGETLWLKWSSGHSSKSFSVWWALNLFHSLKQFLPTTRCQMVGPLCWLSPSLYSSSSLQALYSWFHSLTHGK